MSEIDGRLDVIDHFAVQVSDIASAVHWYRDRFACEVDFQDETWALLRFQNVHVALVIPDQHPTHLAVLRSDAARFGPLSPHRDGTRSVYLDGPAGNAVEVLWRPEARSNP
ncbi:MAG: VOC family protein [Planctomycetes bacterium]|nr:VOC family protein [Planctomycetota bacterium]